MLTQWSDTRKNGVFFFTFLKNFSKVILLLDHDLKTLAPFPSCERNKNDISGRIQCFKEKNSQEIIVKTKL